VLSIFRHHSLLQLRVINGLSFAWRMVVNLLGNLSEGFSFAASIFLTAVNPRDQSDPDFTILVVYLINQADVTCKSTSLFNSNPLVCRKLEILRLITLIDVRHFLLRNQ
jgi:hypothetical protein